MKNIILTGIERSGSSYMVDILNNYSNVVFLNEPPLEYLPHSPERILEYIDSYRTRILSGFPVQNIFKMGTSELAWDTLGAIRGTVESRSYIATFDTPDFIFGFKSLSPMLRHTYKLKRFSDEIMAIALIRHPVDTIYSQLNHGGANLPIVPDTVPAIQKVIKWIMTKQNPVEKAAWIWRFNTSIILDNLDFFKIVRYKSICKIPDIVTALHYNGLNVGEKLRNIPYSEPIRHKDEFSVEGRALIARICRTNAKELGVWD